MKTTVDLPDELFGAARRFASSQGKTFKEVLIESLESFIGASKEAGSRPGWESLFGAFAGNADVAEVQKTIDEEFSRINREEWL